jgi:hypothetical protein
MLSVQSIVASDCDSCSDSSPEYRMLRTLSRSAIVSPSSLSPEPISHTSPSDPDSEIYIPGYLSSLGASQRSPSFMSSSSSSSHSDSETEKCAISDNDLVKIEKLIALVSDRMYSSPDFQKNVYSALDLSQLNFNPAQGRTLGDMLNGLLERHMTLRIDVNAHTLTFRRITDEYQQQANSQELFEDDLEALQKQVHQQSKEIHEIGAVVHDLQNCLVDFQKQMKTYVDLMVTRQALLNVQAEKKGLE